MKMNGRTKIFVHENKDDCRGNQHVSGGHTQKDGLPAVVKNQLRKLSKGVQNGVGTAARSRLAASAAAFCLTFFHRLRGTEGDI